MDISEETKAKIVELQESEDELILDLLNSDLLSELSEAADAAQKSTSVPMPSTSVEVEEIVEEVDDMASEEVAPQILPFTGCGCSLPAAAIENADKIAYAVEQKVLNNEPLNEREQAIWALVSQRSRANQNVVQGEEGK